jgi:hypothetical protein
VFAEYFALFQMVPSATSPSRLELIWGTQRSASQRVTKARLSLAMRCSWAKLADSGSWGVSFVGAGVGDGCVVGAGLGVGSGAEGRGVSVGLWAVLPRARLIPAFASASASLVSPRCATWSPAQVYALGSMTRLFVEQPAQLDGTNAQIT